MSVAEKKELQNTSKSPLPEAGKVPGLHFGFFTAATSLTYLLVSEYLR